MDSKASYFCLLFLLQVLSARGSPPLQLEPKSPLYPQHKLGTATKGWSTKERLPDSAVPTHYKLDIIPIIDHLDVDFKKAPGHVTISVLCLESTNSITMHLNEVIVDNARVNVSEHSSQ
jgi:hypothetical protein